jgi:hypothetical protein
LAELVGCFALRISLLALAHVLVLLPIANFTSVAIPCCAAAAPVRARRALR